MIFFLINVTFALSWKCEYTKFGEISSTHFLYKEDHINEIKWLERYDYCKSKGEHNVYKDAGQGKCEFSRGLCYWNNGICENTNRTSDSLSECQDLINNNILVKGLDNGRIHLPTITFYDFCTKETTKETSNKPASKETAVESKGYDIYSKLCLYSLFFW